jgi:hypothetical protein
MKSVIDGTVDFDFRPQGLVCTIRAPLSERLGVVTDKNEPEAGRLIHRKNERCAIRHNGEPDSSAA